MVLIKGAVSRLNGMKKIKPKFFNIVVCNPCQSSPSLTILVPLWFIIISLVFSHLYKALFSGFLDFRGNFVYGRNNSKYRDVAPLNYTGLIKLSMSQCYFNSNFLAFN